MFSGCLVLADFLYWSSCKTTVQDNIFKTACTENQLKFETYVVSEIIKSYYNAGKRLYLYYYRDIDKKEVDLLITMGDKIYPIEIKKFKNPKAPDKNFSEQEFFLLKRCKKIILTQTKE